jgi:putative (di)nucleoside polyphosphate hydrolase
MIDHDGYRPNICIVILNNQDDILMCRRNKENSWQLPQGGIFHNEKPIDAMYRELLEEVGLNKTTVEIIARTRNWLYYDVPEQFIRPYNKGIYRGQKQIWYLLRMLVDDRHINLNHSPKPEFSDFKWCNYWQASEIVIEFKRNVYILGMQELYRALQKNKCVY